jgi:hypothetical protein
MPYKDPEKRKAAQRKAQAKYAAKNVEKIKLADWNKHQKNRAKRMEARRLRNRSAGHQERPKGPRALPELTLPLSRRWSIFTAPDGVTRLYFTSKKGFTLAEMQEILRTFKDVRQKQLALAAQLPLVP